MPDATNISNVRFHKESYRTYHFLERYISCRDLKLDLIRWRSASVNSVIRNGSLGLCSALYRDCCAFTSHMLNVSALLTRKWKKLRLLRVTPTLKEAETVFNTSDMNHWPWPCQQIYLPYGWRKLVILLTSDIGLYHSDNKHCELDPRENNGT